MSHVIGEELLTFDLQSLATLAAARALELSSQEGAGASAGGSGPARRTLNLRRKCSWTPRNEPVRTTSTVSLFQHTEHTGHHRGGGGENGASLELL